MTVLVKGVQDVGEAWSVAEAEQLIESRPAQVRRHEQRPVPGQGQCASETGCDSRLPFARQRARHEQDVLRTGGQAELERSAQTVVRLVIRFAGRRLRHAALRTVWGRHGAERRQARQLAQLARSAHPRRELIAREGGEDRQESRREEGEDRVLEWPRRARRDRRLRRLRELQLLASRRLTHRQLVEALLNQSNLGRRAGSRPCLTERIPQLAACRGELSPLLVSLNREKGVRDGVRDRGRSLGVVVAPDDVQDVRGPVHRGLNLALERVGGLAGESSRGPVEDDGSDEECLQRRETTLHRLDVSRSKNTPRVGLHDLRGCPVGLGQGERHGEDRQREGYHDERDQPRSAAQRAQVTPDVDRLIAVVGAPGSSPERVDVLGHVIDDRTDSQPKRVLLVSSFVLPHAGGVEQFVETARGILTARGCGVRVLACRLPDGDGTADATVPTRFLGTSGWPLPAGGWRTLWREVQHADVVVGNNARHPLPVLAVLLARVQAKGAIFVVHGSGEGPQTGSGAFRLARAAFQRTLARRAVRISQPVSVSRAGVASIRRIYGVEATYLPYPLDVLPPVADTPQLSAHEPVRIVWVGRLYPEKDPRLAVRALERLREDRPGTLDVYGGGIWSPSLPDSPARAPG